MNCQKEKIKSHKGKNVLHFYKNIF